MVTVMTESTEPFAKKLDIGINVPPKHPPHISTYSLYSTCVIHCIFIITIIRSIWTPALPQNIFANIAAKIVTSVPAWSLLLVV